MMIEYSRGQFGSVLELDEALKCLQEAIAANVPVRALHVGTVAELEERKQETSLLERVEALEKRVAENPQSSALYIPTEEEVRQFKEGEE